MKFYGLLALGVTILTIIPVYLESRLSDKKRSKFDYLKIISLTNIVTLVCVYFIKWLSPDQTIGAVVKAAEGGGRAAIDGATNLVKEIGEEMLSGEPGF